MPYTRLQAVNEIARACGEMRFSALDSTASWPGKNYGASFAGEAEHTLDHVSTAVLTRGWNANVVRSKKYTLASPGEITFATNVLRITPAGPTQYRNITFRNGKAYDLEADTATFAAGDYFFDVVTDHDFDLLPTDIQTLIIAETKAEMQGKLKGNPNVQAIIDGEVAKREYGAMRPKGGEHTVAMNQQPMVMQQPRREQQ